MRMNKIILILLLFAVPPIGGHAQNIPDAFTLVRPDIDSLRFYDALCRLREQEKNYQADRILQNVYYQSLATVYAFNGMADSALVATDKAFTQGVLRQGVKNTDTIDFSAYHAVSAQSYISEIAERQQIIMLNEAHTVPAHRLFTKSLLKNLYDKGYRYLCLEALEFNSVYNESHATFLPRTGFYTKESCFAELIREALRIGYTVRGYEPTKAQYDSVSKRHSGTRDSLMAINIRHILKSTPAAKLLIYAGHGHISKTLPASLYAYLKKSTSITPYSVNQTSYREHASRMYESVYYIAFQNYFTAAEPSVLVDTLNRPVNLSDDSDLYIYHPRTQSTNGRPHWLYENGVRKSIRIKNMHKPSIIKAYYADEVSINKEEAAKYIIPVDILTVETIKKDNHYYLALPEGDFLIQYEDLKGNVYKKYSYQVKR
jgi:hypothetical protein